MDAQLFKNWRRYVPDLGAILTQMQEKTIISVGSLPYRRIVPAFFLKNYHIYCVQDVTDIDVLRSYVGITSLAQHAPKVAARVQSTSYLLNNYVFQGFLKSRRRPFRLFLNQTTPPIVASLQKQRIDWIGNDPESFRTVETKGQFRQILRLLNLPSLPTEYIPRDKLEMTTYEDVRSRFPSFVVQRADKEVGGIGGTFFVHNESDWQRAYSVLSKDDSYSAIQISPFVRGHSVSMLGCVTHQGTLTSMLQLQLIDIPEILAGSQPTGHFMGHDWQFADWNDQTEHLAAYVVESIGTYLAGRGFKGIFGIDFMYDPQQEKLYPIECNPRPTGALPVFSLMTLQQKLVPPLEFFHLMNHLGIKLPFDYKNVNAHLKKRSAISHVSIIPQGIPTMGPALKAGTYTLEQSSQPLRYLNEGVFPWQLTNASEYIIVDSVPRPGASINQNVPQLFKFIFARSIAASSHSVAPDIGRLLGTVNHELRT